MTDRIVEFPNRYLLTLPDGTSILVDLTPAPGEIIDAGTLLHKATLLRDDTAAALGLTSADPTVDEALRSVFHKIVGVDSKVAFTFGSYVGTGEVGENTPNVLTFDKPVKVLLVFHPFSGITIISQTGRTTSYSNGYDSGGSINVVSIGAVFKWYAVEGSYNQGWGSSSGTPTAGNQLNGAGITYYYFGFW